MRGRQATKAVYRSVVVDAIRTAYLDVGDGPSVVLFHSGEYGASARMCWEFNIDALSQHYRVIAPDWLGFGGTDKVFDFGGARARRVRHMQRFLETLDVGPAVFMGNSMGGSLLLASMAETPSAFDARALVLSSGGGFAPDNEARRTIVDYDCTPEGMRRIISVIYADPAWSEDEAYIARRHAASMEPGAWEATAAPRLKPPTVPPRSSFGQPDHTPYESVSVPTLLVAGGLDPLREPGYADEIAARIPRGRAIVYPDCAHMPHAEQAERFNADALAFLAEVYPA